MRKEYDFSGGVRGKHYRALRNGYTVRITKEDGSVEERHYAPAAGSVVLDRDVRVYFPDAESVNNALRSLIALVPSKVPEKHAKRRAARKSE